eukprot:1284210-Alexandrium_andersonii.AAC.1
MAATAGGGDAGARESTESSGTESLSQTEPPKAQGHRPTENQDRDSSSMIQDPGPRTNSRTLAWANDQPLAMV